MSDAPTKQGWSTRKKIIVGVVVVVVVGAVIAAVVLLAPAKKPAAVSVPVVDTSTSPVAPAAPTYKEGDMVGARFGGEFIVGYVCRTDAAAYAMNWFAGWQILFYKVLLPEGPL